MFSTIKQTSLFLKIIILIKLLILCIENKSILSQPLVRIFRGITGKIEGCSLRTINGTLLYDDRFSYNPIQISIIRSAV